MSEKKFTMWLKKTTKYKACFRHSGELIGKIYLPFPLMKKMNINDELLVQLEPDKSLLPEGGYVAKFVFEEEKKRKIKFVEDITEEGELGTIYISKKILESMGVQDEIAVRVVPPSEIGGAALAR